MALVRYVLTNGSERIIAVDPGTSVMAGAIQNNVPGIEAECGGSMDCATCHVYVDTAHFQTLAPATERELELLEGVAAQREPTSRLSCQIMVTLEMGELTIRIPEKQL